MNESPVDVRLSGLRERTQSLGPRPGFQARVLEALAARAHASLRAEVWQSARVFVPVGLLLAVISLGLASRAVGPSSADIAAVEQSWERDF